MEYRTLLNPMYILFVLYLYFKDRKRKKRELLIFGEVIKDGYYNFIITLLIGAFFGIVTSYIFSFLRINLSYYIMFSYVLCTILGILNYRFMCISYGGGIISTILLINSNLEAINILYLIAVTHFIEGILILFDGKRNRNPLYFQIENNVVGGFLIEALWILPILIKINNVLVLLPIFTGYKDVVIDKKIEGKINKSSLLTIIYSITLFVLTVVSINLNIKGVYILTALYSIIGHELIFQLNKENNYELNIKKPNGVEVLDILDSKLPIKQKDIIVRVNNKKVNCIKDIKKILIKDGYYFSLLYINGEGKYKRLIINTNKLNIIPTINNPKYISRVLTGNSIVSSIRRRKFVNRNIN